MQDGGRLGAVEMMSYDLKSVKAPYLAGWKLRLVTALMEKRFFRRLLILDWPHLEAFVHTTDGGIQIFDGLF